jgi:hypothetical protein
MIDDWRGESSDTSPLAHIPPAPRTPSPRARQLIWRYQGGQLVLLILGLSFLAFGLIFTTAFAWGAPGDLALTYSSHAVTGHVISAHENRSVSINGQHPTVIQFRYRDDDGSEHEGSSSTLDPGSLSTIAGAEIPIEVSGSFSRVRGTSYSTFGPWGLLALIFPLAGAILAWFAWRSNRREIRAFRDGRPILAKVVESGFNRSVRINGRNPYLIRWEFTVAGEAFHGSISAIDEELLRDLMKQEQIAVLYDPMNPSVNTVWVG